MGKKRCQKDRLYLTAKELRENFGLNKIESHKYSRNLPFFHCAISMKPFKYPVCTKDGIIFDILNIIPYIQKYGKHPITGEILDLNDLIKLNFCKLNDDEFYCPILQTAFTSRTHIVAIRTSGNVYCYEAINQLHLKTKSMQDLKSGESFKKSDLITIQNPSHKATEINQIELPINAFINYENLKCKKRGNLVFSENSNFDIKQDLSKYKNRTWIETSACESSLLNFRPGASTWNTDKLTVEEQGEKKTKKITKRQHHVRVKEILEKRSICKIIELSTNVSSLSFTSTVISRPTNNLIPNKNERQLKRLQRKPKIKGYVKLRTNIIDLDMELNCETAPKTCDLFLIMCQTGSCDNIIIKKCNENFMIKSSKIRGNIAANELIVSYLSNDAPDKLANHKQRGLISLSKIEFNLENPHFCILLKPAHHFNNDHIVFGKIVSGLETIDTIGNPITNLSCESLTHIRVIGVDILLDPFLEESENDKYLYKN
jgi:peptidyl-prolyl cis-trans isomerase-like protein 2